VEILFFWVGLIFAGVGYLVLRVAKGQDRFAQTVEGEVIGYYQPGLASSKRSMYTPVISFEHPDSGAKIFKSSISANQFIYPLHTKVKVLIDPQEPSRVRLESRGFILFGFVFLFIGIGMCALFFSIFNWNLISVIIAGLVSFGMFRWSGKFFKQLKSIHTDKQNLTEFVKNALTSEVLDAGQFDYSQLLSEEKILETRSKQRRQSLVAAAVLLVAGVGLITLSKHMVIKRQQFLASAQPTSGAVVSLHSSHSDGSTVYYPEVEFKPPSVEAKVRFRHPAGSSHPSWRIGQEVNVLYNPTNPNDAIIDQGTIWNMFFPFLPGIIGALLLVFSALALKSRFYTR